MQRTIALAAALLAGGANAQDAAEGALRFRVACAGCHGPEARGDGAMAELLAIAPPDLTGLAARNGGPFPVLDVASQIDGRDPLLAHGGEMPIFGDYLDGQTVALAAASGQPILTSRPIADLIAFLDSVQQSP